MTEQLIAALLVAVADMHPIYPSTTGWRGGVGGQTLTKGCSFIDPPTESMVEHRLELVLRDAMTDLTPEQHGVVQRLRRELVRDWNVPPEEELDS